MSRLCYQRRRVCGECIEAVYFHGPVSFEDDEASDRAECFEEDKSHRVIRTMSYRIGFRRGDLACTTWQSDGNAQEGNA